MARQSVSCSGYCSKIVKRDVQAGGHFTASSRRRPGQGARRLSGVTRCQRNCDLLAEKCHPVWQREVAGGGTHFPRSRAVPTPQSNSHGPPNLTNPRSAPRGVCRSLRPWSERLLASIGIGALGRSAPQVMPLTSLASLKRTKKQSVAQSPSRNYTDPARSHQGIVIGARLQPPWSGPLSPYIQVWAAGMTNNDGLRR
jgi:hypothetical protein